MGLVSQVNVNVILLGAYQFCIAWSLVKYNKYTGSRSCRILRHGYCGICRGKKGSVRVITESQRQRWLALTQTLNKSIDPELQSRKFVGPFSLTTRFSLDTILRISHHWCIWYLSRVDHLENGWQARKRRRYGKNSFQFPPEQKITAFFQPREEISSTSNKQLLQEL